MIIVKDNGEQVSNPAVCYAFSDLLSNVDKVYNVQIKV